MSNLTEGMMKNDMLNLFQKVLAAHDEWQPIHSPGISRWLS